MAKLLDLFSGGGEAKQAQDLLTFLAKFEKSVRIEIEHTPINFYSSVKLKSGQVALSNPKIFNKFIEKGKWVRLCPEESGKNELRLEISSADLARSGERNMFFCRLPSAAIGEPKRVGVRHFTGHFKDLKLELVGHASGYRILDVSNSGVRIQLNSEEEGKRFTVGTYLETKGRIRLGERASVALLDMVPRFLSTVEAGLEIVVNPEGNSRAVLKAFLNTIEKKSG